MAENFRLNQKVVRIGWKRGYPFLQFARVTKVTQKTYRVNGEKKSSYEWYSSFEESIEKEYLWFFSRFDMLLGKKDEDWTVKDSLRCIFRIRRMERRLQRKGITTA